MLEIRSAACHSALNPVCSSAVVSSAWGYDFQHGLTRMTDETDSSVGPTDR